MSITASKTRHVKFDSDEEAEGPVETARISKETQSEKTFNSDESDDDDDEAPEEEGLSNGKSIIENEIKQREEALRREQEELKERRRKNDAKFKEQQIAKGSRAKIEAQESTEELPEELPEEFFEKLEQQTVDKVEQMPRHVNFNDIDGQQYVPEIKKQIQKRKLKTLKKLRASTVTRGSFNVTVLEASQNLSSMAPKRENPIMNTKDKWLRRKAIKRK